jgi:hypothetical protein
VPTGEQQRAGQNEEEKKEEEPSNQPSSQRERQNALYMTKADAENDVIHLAAQTAPILDRVGRLLSDMAPQLNNIVKQHQLKTQNELRDTLQSSN